jgi:hypothetical protein
VRGMQLERLELGLGFFPPQGIYRPLTGGCRSGPRPQRPARGCSYRGQAGAGERFALYGVVVAAATLVAWARRVATQVTGKALGTRTARMVWTCS